MSYKKTDGLMRHLRDNGISISGSAQKRQLRNTGYFHGYKGYRFFNNASQKIPYTNYDDVYATIKYDSKLKALFYEKIMFIETAVKNRSLECIMDEAKSESIQAMYDRVICGYKNCPPSADKNTKKHAQENKLKLENCVQSYLVKAYKSGNPQITHFYNNMGYSGVPLWALFEIITLGDFGYLLSCLTWDTRDALTKELGLNVTSIDTNRELIYKYIYTLKDLRNAIAHNSVVFDTRFRKSDPSKPMKLCLEQAFSLPYVNFKTIGDYLFLMCYYLKLLEVSKTEIKAFIRGFEKITDEYRDSVDPAVYSMVVHPDLKSRIDHVFKNI